MIAIFIFVRCVHYTVAKLGSGRQLPGTPGRFQGDLKGVSEAWRGPERTLGTKGIVHFGLGP